ATKARLVISGGKKKLDIMIGCIDKFDQPAGLQWEARPPSVLLRGLPLHERDARAYIYSLGGGGQLPNRADEGGSGAGVGAVAPVSNAELPPKLLVPDVNQCAPARH